MPPVVAVSAHKGGVGKSSTTGNLAAGAAAAGLRVLVLDADQQGNVSELLGTDPNDIVAGDGLSAVYLDGEPLANKIRETGVPNLHLVVGDEPLADVDYTLGIREGRARAAGGHAPWSRILDEAVRELGDAFDLVLVDTPPGFGTLVSSVICAADVVLSPVVLEPHAIRGLERTAAAVERARHSLKARAMLGGVVLQMLDLRSGYARATRDAIRGHPAFGPLVYATEIPRTVRMVEASHVRSTIGAYDATSVVARQYEALWQEFAARTSLTVGASAPAEAPSHA